MTYLRKRSPVLPELCSKPTNIIQDMNNNCSITYSPKCLNLDRCFQDLLANPDLSKPINPEAAEMIMRSPHAYRQMVLDCVVASQRVEGSYEGIDPAKYSKCHFIVRHICGDI